jgi:hypothetical protein
MFEGIAHAFAIFGSELSRMYDAWLNKGDA